MPTMSPSLLLLYKYYSIILQKDKASFLLHASSQRPPSTTTTTSSASVLVPQPKNYTQQPISDNWLILYLSLTYYLRYANAFYLVHEIISVALCCVWFTHLKHIHLHVYTWEIPIGWSYYFFYPYLFIYLIWPSRLICFLFFFIESEIVFHTSRLNK